ncbi:hypothetical protein PIB30_045252 [Stylosanthes scabra]|uniref:Uncharacterized protein n=1 Tax=Stylosanthes scabra TaxID=79078 RepID=A0ABU6YGK2_9FABA|nr:hypothetical protein [Stylosanthes scabra]
MGNFSQSLQALMLQGNKLVGHIPQTYPIGSVLRIVDLSENNLQGELPRALVNCRMLEFLDVGYNQINDSFPFWLSTLPELKVISLRHNEFYGPIKCPKPCTFSKLHILDCSHNKFSGTLLPEMIKSWKSMMVSNARNIPQQLTELTFLEFFNVSFNKLTGTTPAVSSLVNLLGVESALFEAKTHPRRTSLPSD